MRDEDDGLARLHPDFLDQQVHLVAREGVERAERLVHQQHGRIDREAAHDRGALLHAAREFARDIWSRSPSRLTRSSSLAMRSWSGARPLDLERKRDVLGEIAPGQQIGVLKDHRDLGMRLGDRARCRAGSRRRSGRAGRPSTTAASILPQPDGPRMHRNSPSRTSSDTLSSACTAPDLRLVELGRVRRRPSWCAPRQPAATGSTVALWLMLMSDPSSRDARGRPQRHSAPTFC